MTSSVIKTSRVVRLKGKEGEPGCQMWQNMSHFGTKMEIYGNFSNKLRLHTASNDLLIGENASSFVTYLT